jgi:hypothetical protein
MINLVRLLKNNKEPTANNKQAQFADEVIAFAKVSADKFFHFCKSNKHWYL